MKQWYALYVFLYSNEIKLKPGASELLFKCGCSFYVVHKQVLDIFNLCLKKTIVDSIYECIMQRYVAKWKQNQLSIFLFMYLLVI